MAILHKSIFRALSGYCLKGDLTLCTVYGFLIYLANEITLKTYDKDDALKNFKYFLFISASLQDFQI